MMATKMFLTTATIYELPGPGIIPIPISPPIIVDMPPSPVPNNRSRSVLSTGPNDMFSTVYPLIRSANQYGPTVSCFFPPLSAGSSLGPEPTLLFAAASRIDVSVGGATLRGSSRSTRQDLYDRREQN